VRAVQDIANFADTFKSKLIAWFADASNGIGDFFAKVGHFAEVHAQKYCAQNSDGTETCVTGDQLKSMLAGSAAAGALNNGSQSGAPASVSANFGGDAGSSTTTAPVVNSPPTLIVNGNDPATVQVGVSYADLGATITGPQADLNLGIHIYVDGTPTDAVQLDTGKSGTHSIDYVVAGHSGLTSTTTRTVIVSSPANDNQASSTPTAANDNLPLPLMAATGTDPTTTAQ
jgi:surface protein with Ig-like domain